MLGNRSLQNADDQRVERGFVFLSPTGKLLMQNRRHSNLKVNYCFRHGTKSPRSQKRNVGVVKRQQRIAYQGTSGATRSKMDLVYSKNKRFLDIFRGINEAPRIYHKIMHHEVDYPMFSVE